MRTAGTPYGSCPRSGMTRLLLSALGARSPPSPGAATRARRQSAERLAAATLETLMNAIDANDADTGAHVRRVAAYALCWARRRPRRARAAQVERVALFHDIGKIHEALFDIVHDDDRLTTPSASRSRRTARAAPTCCTAAAFYPELPAGVLAHHERWDGGGYPRGLRGEEIPLMRPHRRDRRHASTRSPTSAATDAGAERRRGVARHRRRARHAVRSAPRRPVPLVRRVQEIDERMRDVPVPRPRTAAVRHERAPLAAARCRRAERAASVGAIAPDRADAPTARRPARVNAATAAERRRRSRRSTARSGAHRVSAFRRCARRTSGWRRECARSPSRVVPSASRSRRASRTATSCSANVVRNSWCPSGCATKYRYGTFAGATRRSEARRAGGTDRSRRQSLHAIRVVRRVDLEVPVEHARAVCARARTAPSGRPGAACPSAGGCSTPPR